MSAIKYFIIIAFCLMSVSAQTQFFSKTIDYDKGRDMVYSIETDDTGYVLTGASSDSLTWEVYVFFAHHDKFGNPTYHKIIRDTNNSYFCGLYGSLTRLRNGRYILGGSIRNKLTSDANALLYYYNANGDTIFTREIQSNRFEIFNFTQEAPDGSWYAAGETSSMGDTMQDVFVVKFDSLGNVLWKKSYGYLGKTEYISSFDIDSQGNLYFGCCRVVGYTPNYPISLGFVLKLDSAGNQIWTTYLNNIDSQYPIGSNSFVHVYNDTTIIVSFGKGDLNTDAIAMLSRLDGAGNIKITKQISGLRRTNGLLRFVNSKDGNIVGSGLSNMSIVPLNADDGGWVCKFSPDCDIIWSRYYIVKQGQDQSFFLDIDTSHFGGYILAGGYWNTVQDVWLMSTDSMGCLGPDSCGVLQPVALESDLNSPIHELLAYPNPAQDLLYIQIPDLYIQPIPAAPKAGKTSRLYDPMRHAPVNPFLVQEEIQVFSPDREEELQAATYDSDCLIQLYAMDGRLIRSQSQPWSQTMELSVSDLPSGIYFLRVRQGGNVYAQKVVVGR